MYYLASDPNQERRMKFALLIAALTHAALIVGVGFVSLAEPEYAPQIEVTLATRPNTTAPQEARYKAQANQVGSGEQAQHAPMSMPSSAMPVAGQGELSTSASRDVSRDPLSRHRLSTDAEARRKTAREPEENQQQDAGMEGVVSEADRLADQLAQLESRLDEQHQAYANRPRVRRVSSASARAAVDAAYLQSWRQRVEAVGNKYYPEASIRYGLYGSLRLLVVVRADGNLDDIRILSSSGYDALDEAAIKIVRMAAPFPPFPDELQATTDKLEIIRTWQFEENGLSSG